MDQAEPENQVVAGTSKNAVLKQIWVAMYYYLLLSYIKFQTKFIGTLQVLTRMIASVLMDHRLINQKAERAGYSSRPFLTGQ
jgi:hypothetical protein